MADATKRIDRVCDTNRTVPAAKMEALRPDVEELVAEFNEDPNQKYRWDDSGEPFTMRALLKDYVVLVKRSCGPLAPPFQRALARDRG